jgi:endonuclease/exonuclease/phosphatase family metal-dependent hydrolase
MGDFNDEPESAVLDVMHRAGYRDTWTADSARHAGWVTFKTNPAQGTFRDMRIDFILANRHLDVVDAAIDVDCDASDHQPVWATVALR